MKVHQAVLRKIPGAHHRLLITIILLVLLGAQTAPGSWRWYGYDLFTHGDEAILRAPDTIFERELDRFGILKPGQERGGGSRENSADEIAQAEAADLQAALLSRTNLTRELRDRITREHLAERQRFLVATAPIRWRRRYDLQVNEPIAALNVSSELPVEFSDYLAGAVAWHHAETNAAISAWETLLARPASDRRYKSVWAEFMLGRVRLEAEPERAIEHFQRTRTLAKEGFADRLHLAHASFGQEARANLKLGRAYSAAKLYLEQARLGGWADTLSIEWTVSRAIRDGTELNRFANDPELRRVLTAAITSHNRWEFTNGSEPNNRSGVVARWANAVTEAKISDPILAEQLVLATFIHQDYDLTRQWLKLSPQTPVTQWIRAKLFLAEGKVSAGTALMENLAPAFVKPDPESEENAAVPTTMLENFACWRAGGHYSQFHAELATLRLTQGRFIAALEGYLESDYWGQAAYIAERVLTLDELKTFVDARWETFGPSWTQEEDGKITHHPPKPVAILLGRRLTREGRGHEAARYFPSELQTAHAALVTHLRTAWEEAQPADSRIAAFIAAGRIARTNGLALIGTELEPDFAIYDGQEEGTMIAERLHGKARASDDESAITERRAPRWILPSAEERRRAAAIPADPMERWHYRYIASDLLWRAAELLPDQTDTKARVLIEGGSWLKYTYPEAADRYYKALVRSCGKTELGTLANALRWFPRMDAAGNPVPGQLRQRNTTPAPPPTDNENATLLPEATQP